MAPSLPRTLPEPLWSLRASWVSSKPYQGMRDSLADVNHLWLGSRRGQGKRAAFSADHKLQHNEEVPIGEGSTSLKDSEADLPEHIYAALTKADSIRLVRLAPGRNDEAITIRIVASALGLHASFKALSYTWRPDKPRHILSCGQSFLEIGHTLWCALRHIRDDSAEQHVWIDAICIDQTNNFERAQQVQIMRQIYQAAEETVIWLGMPRIGTDAVVVFDLLRKLAQAHADDHPAARQFPMTHGHLEAKALPPMADDAWKLLDALFWKHWFTRAWIIYEVAVSRTAIVRYGNQAIGWSSFARGADYIMQHTLTRLTGVDPNRTMLLEGYRRGVHSNDDTPVTLLELLCQARSSYATDPRDKIFALIGLASDANDIGLVPSYDADVGTVYVDLARRIIEGNNSLDFLTACQDEALGDNHNLPSWVPDWEVHPWATPFKLLNQWEKWQPILQDERLIDFFANDEPRTLNVTGVISDVVNYISDTCLDHFKLAGGINATHAARFAEGRMLHGTKTLASMTVEFFGQQRYRQWERIALRAGKALGIGEQIVPHFALAAVAGQQFPNISSENKTGSLYAIDYYRPWKRLRQHFDHTGSSSISADVLDYEELQKALHFEAAHQRAAYGRRFVTTKTHHFIGMCHSAVRAGDSVVLLRGARTPFIIRKTKKRSFTGEIQWKFLGEAYVHGLILRTDTSRAQRAAQRDEAATLPLQRFRIV